jgi:molecular chaperone DnaK (HSP70)
MSWALDLGTTNTGIARWDDDADRPRLAELQNICRRPGRVDPLEAPRLVPSAVHIEPDKGLKARIGRWGWFRKNTFWGREAYIGREALDRNEGWSGPNYAPTFKAALAVAPNRHLARVRSRSYTAREVARIFLRELLREVQASTGERIRDLVITTPVEAFEAYRAELAQAAKLLGITRLRFIDEPVAAAIGYGLGIDASKRILVADFGGGTLDLAVVQLSMRELESGTCNVVAKEGRPVGGNLVDQWLLEAFAEQMGLSLEGVAGEGEMWRRLMLDEARRVKEAVYFEPKATFEITPPDDQPGLKARMRDRPRFLDVTREDVVQILRDNALYDILGDCCDGLRDRMAEHDLEETHIDEVLMVGGSTLLPQVYGYFEQRYGRDRVRAWQPFEAVAYGACAFAADRFAQSDFIVHEYAMVTFDPKTHDKKYATIVPRGTRFPTAPDLWKRRLVPTCSLGEPEKIFQLVVCEVGTGGADRRFAWDAEGNVHRVGGDDENAPIIVPLNAANPTLGYLKPPHTPGDRTPRLEISFGVDENRWLIATVLDLKTKQVLMKQEPVVRLL